MQKCFAGMWREDDGVLSFEWVLLVTLVAIGIVGGVAAARDAIIDELGDVAEGMLALDQSFTVDSPLGVQIHAVASSAASDSGFVDAMRFTDCARAGTPNDQEDDVGIP